MEGMNIELSERQVAKLRLPHFLILYWAGQAEVKGICYNITNVFDDLKNLEVTRTKQSVMAYVDVLNALCMIEVMNERNRKNIYLTDYGTRTLEILDSTRKFEAMNSRFLEVV